MTTCPVSSCDKQVESSWDLCLYHYVQKQKNKLSATTRLSEKEAEQYALRQRGLSTAEIAEEMGVSVNTVQSRRGKIREKVREARNTAGLDL